MKNLILIVLLAVASTLMAQEKRFSPEFRVSGIAMIAFTQPSKSYYLYDSDPTYLLHGIDFKMIFPSKHTNLKWMLGSLFVFGGNSSLGWTVGHENLRVSNTYGGGIYFGPQLNAGWKFLYISTYISGGIFSFHDDMLETADGKILYNPTSNFTAPGTKSGINLTTRIKAFTLTGGYHIFATAAQNNTLFYHGIEVGIGFIF